MLDFSGKTFAEIWGMMMGSFGGEAGLLPQLSKMGIGMLGVFMIIGVIIGATYLIGALSSRFSKKDGE